MAVYIVIKENTDNIHSVFYDLDKANNIANQLNQQQWLSKNKYIVKQIFVSE